MKLSIPGQKDIEITDVLFDYNGTLAVDGVLYPEVAEQINALADQVNFHVITADTFGSVQAQLKDVTCQVVTIADDEQDQQKLDYLLKLGKDNTMAVGNGMNDHLMLKESVIGIALLQDEGLCRATLMASDLLCKSINDVFAYFHKTNRLVASLRN